MYLVDLIIKSIFRESFKISRYGKMLLTREGAGRRRVCSRGGHLYSTPIITAERYGEKAARYIIIVACWIVCAYSTIGHRPNGFLGLSLNDSTILFLVILLDKTVSVR